MMFLTLSDVKNAKNTHEKIIENGVAADLRRTEATSDL